jgi:hypothetical protein
MIFGWGEGTEARPSSVESTPMSLHDFYSRFASDQEDNPFFVALRKLSRLEPRELMADGDEGNAWSAWDATGSPPDGAFRLITDPA